MQSADDAEHTKWGGLSPPYLQLGGAEAPPAPPVPTPLLENMKDLKKEVNQEEKGCIKEKGVDEGLLLLFIGNLLVPRHYNYWEL